MKVVKPSIVFWGTPEFALPSLGALIKNGYDVVAVVTNPDEPVGRTQTLTPPPVKIYAKKHMIPVFQPISPKDPNFGKELPTADLYVVSAYGKIIPKEILDIPKFGAINVHPSLLPRWRGPSPIQYTILEGDKEAGVTIMKVDERMDHGPILARQEWTNFQFSRLRQGYDGRAIFNFQKLHEELAKLGAELLIEVLPKYLQGEITPIPQDDSQATYSKILKRDDGRINWSRPAEYIERMVRAFNQWPGTWTLWPSETKIYRIKIEEAEAVEDSTPLATPGFLWASENFPLLVKTNKGSLAIRRLTLGGKKSTDVRSFLRGHPRIIGATFV